MRRIFHTWLTALLLLTLPLQGLAAVLMPIHCAPSSSHATGDAVMHQHGGVSHDHGSAASEASQHAQHDKAPATDNEAGHFCCNHVYTGAPLVIGLSVSEPPFVSLSLVSITPPLFFPEQLLRPPRA